jgi:glycosyltransferase involved in cell wall biosynthesis
MAGMTADAPTRILDITRLVSRIGRGPLTGVDRVERAYLRRFQNDSAPLFLLLHTSFGHLLLRGAAGADVLRYLETPADLPQAGLVGRIGRRPTARVLTEAALRPEAVARAWQGGLGPMIRRTCPGPVEYFNVGHSNLSETTLGQLAAVHDLSVTVMIHDTIPLDHPSFSAAGASAAFRAKLTASLRQADRILCPSRATADAVRRHPGPSGQCPDIVVAPLGLDRAAPDATRLPDLPQPFFLTLGTIEPRKNHVLLLGAWEHLHSILPPANIPTLVIAGSRGWRNGDVFRRLDAHPPGIIELPDLSDGAVAALLTRATALLMPSFAEGFGLPVAEALARDCRVIAADLPVYRELFGNSPVYADPNDLYSWADKIKELGAGRGERAESSGSVAALTWGNHFKAVLTPNG